MFQLDDSKSLYRKWLFHQTSIYKWLFGVPGSSTKFGIDIGNQWYSKYLSIIGKFFSQELLQCICEVNIQEKNAPDKSSIAEPLIIYNCHVFIIGLYFHCCYSLPEIWWPGFGILGGVYSSYLRTRRSFREQGARHPSSGHHRYYHLFTTHRLDVASTPDHKVPKHSAPKWCSPHYELVGLWWRADVAAISSHCGAFVELPFFFDEEDQALTTVRVGWWGFRHGPAFHASLTQGHKENTLTHGTLAVRGGLHGPVHVLALVW